uniref:Dip1-associated protein C n=1 Tax=Crypthecodinium cohnii TaxID=2866 RepID=Q9LD31_CRYCO|nr:Dip1-associated protein C [Crypthecodinium cohnii]
MAPPLPPGPPPRPPGPSTTAPAPAGQPPLPAGLPPLPGGDPPLPTGSATSSPPLPSGSPPLPQGAPPVPAGAPPLPSGSPPLPSGLPPLPTGGPPLPAGSPPLPAGSPPLPAGPPPVPPLPTGSPPLPAGAPPLPAGSPPLPAGSPPLPAGSPPLPAGAPPVQAGSPAPTDQPSAVQAEAEDPKPVVPVVPFQIAADSHCTRKADQKTKGSTRNVIIKDLAKVAAALKITVPQLPSPCALLSVFEGNPMAAEHCARSLHSKLLTRLSKLGAARATPTDLKRALSASLVELDAELRERMPGLEGSGAAIALVLGSTTMLLAVVGQCGATLCGEDPVGSLDQSKKKGVSKHSWTSAGRPRALNPQAVAEAAARERALAAGQPVEAPAPKATGGPHTGSIHRLQAKVPTRQLGSPDTSAGSFGGRKPGALDPTMTKGTKAAAVDMGAGGVFTAGRHAGRDGVAVCGRARGLAPR